jgi:lipooligosaccharide transport system permease protein
LIGLTVASIALILTATASTIGAMNNFFTVFIIPMFYVSGVFFPLDHVPHTVKMLSWALPLTPAAALTRGLVSGDLTWLMVLWALQLLAISVVALCVASFFMHRRLIK